MKIQIGKSSTRARRHGAQPTSVGSVLPSGGVMFRVDVADDHCTKVWLEFEPTDSDLVDRLIERLTAMRTAARS